MCPPWPALGSQQARCCHYPISWLGLKDPKNLVHGCLAKGMCKVQMQDPSWEARPHSYGGEKASSSVAAPATRQLPHPELMGTWGAWPGPSPDQHRRPLECWNDCIFLLRTIPALFPGSYLTFYFKKLGS